ncbi:hypothetical protein G6F22_020863 [Rhizopus arrhizus]|nr:hypothetical protein G6F22_020863 [Rhizopus arrhizus]
MGQGIAQRILAGGARIDLVALVAVHPGDDGPRRMVMRRLCLARFAQRQVQRIAAVDVLGQTIDRGRAARHDGKGLGGKQVAALPQRLQQRRYLGQLRGRGLRRIGRQLPDLGDEGAHGPCAFGVRWGERGGG